MPLLWWVFPPHHRFPPYRNPKKPRLPPCLGLLLYLRPLLLMIALRRASGCFVHLAPGQDLRLQTHPLTFVLNALPSRHLEHQLGQAAARSRQPLRQGGAAGCALPARDQMRRGQVPRARARARSASRISRCRGRRAITASPRSRAFRSRQSSAATFAGAGMRAISR